jgi:hypothetical protein
MAAVPQMMAEMAKAAKTNFAIWALLRQLLPPLTDGNLQGIEAPRSEALHTTMALADCGRAWRGRKKAGHTTGPAIVDLAGPVGSKLAPMLCAQRAGASTPGDRSRQLNAQANGPGMPGPTRCHSTTGNVLTLRPVAGRRQRPKNRALPRARCRIYAYIPRLNLPHILRIFHRPATVTHDG